MGSVRFSSFRFLKCRFIPGSVQASVRVGWKELAVPFGLRFVSNLPYFVLKHDSELTASKSTAAVADPDGHYKELFLESEMAL